MVVSLNHQRKLVNQWTEKFETNSKINFMKFLFSDWFGYIIACFV